MSRKPRRARSEIASSIAVAGESENLARRASSRCYRRYRLRRRQRRWVFIDNRRGRTHFHFEKPSGARIAQTTLLFILCVIREQISRKLE